jgi:hypothetical protein
VTPGKPKTTLLENGVPYDRIKIVLDERKAVRAPLRRANRDDLNIGRLSA